MELEKKILTINRLLADYFVLYIKLHRYCWYVKGKQFSSLKNWYETKLIVCKSHINQLVELILILEGQPFATMEKYVKEATLEEATADDETEEMMSQLLHDANHLLKITNEIIEKKTEDQASRLVQQTMLPLEHELLKMKHECKNYFK